MRAVCAFVQQTTRVYNACLLLIYISVYFVFAFGFICRARCCIDSVLRQALFSFRYLLYYRNVDERNTESKDKPIDVGFHGRMCSAHKVNFMQTKNEWSALRLEFVSRNPHTLTRVLVLIVYITIMWKANSHSFMYIICPHDLPIHHPDINGNQNPF